MIKFLSYKNRQYYFLLLIIVVFSTNCYLFTDLDTAIDYFRVVVMVFASALFLIRFNLTTIDIPFWILYVLMFLSSLYNGLPKFNSYVYGLLFVFTFFRYKQGLFKNIFSNLEFEKVLKGLIYAYFIVIIIQQSSRFLGIPIFNGLSFYTDDYRFNSLSSEPSHSSMILLVVMVSYMYMKQLNMKRKYTIQYIYSHDKLLWFAYLYTLFTSGASTAYLVIPVTLCFFLSLRTFLLMAISFVFLFYLSVTFIDIPVFNRVKTFLPALLSLNTDVISKADLSGAARINPIIFYFQDINLFSTSFWLGYGRGYSEPMLMERVLGNETDLVRGAGGVFPILFYDYGIICGLFFLYCLRRYCYHKSFKFYFVIWICFLYSVDLNTYLQWIFITLSFTTIYFYKQQLNEKLYIADI